MIKITAKNFKLTNGLKNLTMNKLEKFEKLLSEGEYIDVVMEIKPYGQKIKVSFRTNNQFIRAESIQKNLYFALDSVADKLKVQISKYYGQLNNRDKESIRFNTLEIEDEKDTETNLTPQIVKRKYISKKPMMEEEAILQMELLGYESFIFFNADTSSTSMLYKRHDGNYGIIEENLM